MFRLCEATSKSIRCAVLATVQYCTNVENRKVPISLPPETIGTSVLPCVENYNPAPITVQGRHPRALNANRERRTKNRTHPSRSGIPGLAMGILARARANTVHNPYRPPVRRGGGTGALTGSRGRSILHGPLCRAHRSCMFQVPLDCGTKRRWVATQDDQK